MRTQIRACKGQNVQEGGIFQQHIVECSSENIAEKAAKPYGTVCITD